jgi:hypothetical protein
MKSTIYPKKPRQAIFGDLKPGDLFQYPGNWDPNEVIMVCDWQEDFSRINIVSVGSTEGHEGRIYKAPDRNTPIIRLEGRIEANRL